jgi:hypothetical protein
MKKKQVKTMTDNELTLLRWKLLSEHSEDKTCKARNRRYRVIVQNEIDERKK